MKKTPFPNFSQNPPHFRKSFDEVLARVMTAAGAATETALAEILGIKQSSISSARKRGNLPPSWIMDIALKTGFSSDWIAFNEGEPRRLGHSVSVTGSPVEEGFSMVPKVKARLCAETGSLDTSGEISGHYAFKTDFLTRKGNPLKMILMDVFGESMQPTIEGGDTVLIDQSQREIIAGRIYAIRLDDDILVKYVEKIPGRYVLRSSNRAYSPIEVDFEDESTIVKVIGRVLWWCREAR